MASGLWRGTSATALVANLRSKSRVAHRALGIASPCPLFAAGLGLAQSPGGLASRPQPVGALPLYRRQVGRAGSRWRRGRCEGRMTGEGRQTTWPPSTNSLLRSGGWSLRGARGARAIQGRPGLLSTSASVAGLGSRSRPPVEIASCRRAWWARTRAVIASTMGTARGRTHGSCRPRPRMVVSSRSTLTVACSCMMVAVAGTDPKNRSSPLLIPPCTPPLVVAPGRDRRPCGTRRCAQSGQVRAREAGADLEALARGETERRLGRPPSSRSNTGSPQPGGQPRAATSRCRPASCRLCVPPRRRQSSGGHGRVRAANGRTVDVGSAHLFEVGLGYQTPNLGNAATISAP